MLRSMIPFLLGMFLASFSDGFQPPSSSTTTTWNGQQGQRSRNSPKTAGTRSYRLSQFVIFRQSMNADDGSTIVLPPSVWIQDGEDDFVDNEENLEEGEICLKSIKAFASPLPESSGSPRFLSAGALVQRGPGLHSVCDAWTADAILEEGGPNLQFQGACLILDKLLQFHLERNQEDPITALRTFIVQCSDDMESETSCASYMAAKSRGFRPLKELLRETSIYTKSTYIDCGSLDGMVLDIHEARDFYQRLTEQVVPCRNVDTLCRILQLLPDEDIVQRFTIKRFSAK